MRTHRARLGIAIVAVGLLAGASGGVAAFGDGDHHGPRSVRGQLSGYEQDPLTISTMGTGRFRAWVDAEDEEINFALSYSRLEGAVTQSHIHFGGRHQSGGVIVWLCTTAGLTAPAGTQTCPDAPATVTGTITPAEVVGPTDQGIAPGEFDELIAAMRADTTYVNVHTDLYPAGEIRTQLERGHHHD